MRKLRHLFFCGLREFLICRTCFLSNISMHTDIYKTIYIPKKVNGHAWQEVNGWGNKLQRDWFRMGYATVNHSTNLKLTFDMEIGWVLVNYSFWIWQHTSGCKVLWFFFYQVSSSDIYPFYNFILLIKCKYSMNANICFL